MVEGTKNTKKQKILLVDDVVENIQVLSNVLYKKGVGISVATSGEQAIKTALSKPIDLILLDISMPGMDGLEVCRLLKTKEKTKGIPIIFLTARTQPEDIIKGFEAGAVDYVTKPFNHAELLSRVFTHLELKSAKDNMSSYIKTIDQQNKQLQDLNHTKDKFFSIISHDLKSPFTAMISFSEFAVKNFDKMDDSKKKYFLKEINKSANNTYSLLENLLHWSRSQTGQIFLCPADVEIMTIVNKCYSLLEMSLKKKNINFVVDVAENLTAYVDKNTVMTVIRNLLSNAIKFTGDEGDIALKAESNEDEITISVSDSGIGMKPEDVEKLFKIDVNTNKIGKSKEKGTGLGLILCKEFVEKNGGKIWVESEIEKGSKFYFTLPTKNV